MATDNLFARRFEGAQGGAKDLFDIKRHVRSRGSRAATSTVAWFLETLREGPRADGGYPKFWLTSDGDTLSYKACLANCGRIARAIRENSGDGWRVVACDINWEDADMRCCETDLLIPPAYS